MSLGRARVRIPGYEGMKTVRQIAEELGVSKTAVSKHIENLGLKSSLQKNGNQFLIDERQEVLIRQAFSEKTQTANANQSQAENNEACHLVDVLQATIDTLQGQLEAKDRQLEQQAQTITRLTDALAAALAFHAGTIRQQLPTGETVEDQQGQESEHPKEQPKRWWHRTFGKLSCTVRWRKADV